MFSYRDKIAVPMNPRKTLLQFSEVPPISLFRGLTHRNRPLFHIAPQSCETTDEWRSRIFRDKIRFPTARRTFENFHTVG